ncbi:MAG: hypothetical protein GXO26_03145 [Crenarchaeota archaeon]|nr:hypothetical protein [Thermoproteota archaeon]
MSEQLLRGRTRVLISAYPGFGKTRLIPHLARLIINVLNVDKVLILCRSIAEVDELCKFFKEFSNDMKVSPLVGRERLCPYGAKSLTNCSILRDRGTCPLSRVRSPPHKIPLKVFDINDIIEFSKIYNVCPYDLSISLAIQSNIVISTVTYLSNKSLYENIMKIFEHEKIGVIIDEAHSIIQGLESSVETRVNLEDILGIELGENEHIVIRNPKLDIDNLKKSLSVEYENIINILFSDILYICKRAGIYRIHGLTLSTLNDLLKRAKAVILLSASITREFASSFPVLKDFYKIFIDDPPREIENLRIFIIPDLEFKDSFKYTKACVRHVLNIVKEIIPNLPLIGGIMILFSSKKFMNHVLRDLEILLKDLEVPYVVYSEDEDSRSIIEKFKNLATYDRCVLITYAGSPLCEGVNFTGDELICVMMFGFPFPEFSYWNLWKASYLYKSNYFLLSFIYTAISTTIQVVGRCMRDLDKRVKYVFLIDKRFLRYRKYFPRWFPKLSVVSVRELGETFSLL